MIIASLIFSAMIGLIIGLYLHKIASKLDELLKREPEDEGRTVSPLPPEYVSDTSAVVTPKTPREIEFEEQERVRNL